MKNYITKEQILKETTGLNISLKFLELLDIPKKNISSPFTDDKNPSFKIYKDGTYKCNSTGKQGDCFQLVADLYHLDTKTNFREILETIVNKLNISLPSTPNNKTPHKFFSGEKGKIIKTITQEGLNYWKNLSVSKDTLNNYGIKQFINEFNEEEIIFAIPYKSDKYKLYRPEIKENGVLKQVKCFQSCTGSKSSNDFIFGLSQIQGRTKTIIICAGEKDALVVNSIYKGNVHAITFGSENAHISTSQIEEIKSKTDKLFVCLDNDRTGIKKAKEISNTFDIPRIRFDQEYNDLADLLPKKGPDTFDLHIENAEKSFEQKKETYFTEEYFETFYHYTTDRGKKKSKNIANFRIEPLYFIKYIDDAIRIVKLISEIETSKPIYLTRDLLVNVNNAKKEFLKHGDFHFTGQNTEWELLKKELFGDLKRLDGIDKLGFDPKSKSFVLSNGAIKDGKFHKANSEGIVVIDKKITDLYLGDYTDPLENSNYKNVCYNEGGLTLNDFFTNLSKVFGKERTLIGLFTFIGGIFFDVITKSNDNAPYLFLYGETSSGKNTFIEFIYSMFGNPQITNLNTSTSNAITDRLSQTSNIPVIYDEYSEESRRNMDERLKAANQLQGRERSTYNSDSKTINKGVTSSFIVLGEVHPDKESVINRAIMLNFKKKDKTETSYNAMMNLKSNIKKGEDYQNGRLLLDIMSISNVVRDTYKTEYKKTLDTIESRLKNIQNTERISQSFAMPLTMFKICIKEKIIDNPFEDIEEALNIVENAIKSQIDLVKEQNILTKFFQTLEMMTKEPSYRIDEYFDIQRVNEEFRLHFLNGIFLKFNQYYKNHLNESANINRIKEALKSHEAFLGHLSYRFPNSQHPVKAFSFDLTKLQELELTNIGLQY